MAAGYQNLYIDQGSSYSITITLDDVFGDIYDLTGYTAESQMRRSYYSANTSAQFAVTLNSGTGALTLSLDSANSSTLIYNQYVYDTILIDSSNNATRILEGIVYVSPSVSR